jgi:hypothetical protein
MQELTRQNAGGASAWLSRSRHAPAEWHLPPGCQLLVEVRGSSPCLGAQEGSPHSHRMPCGGSGNGHTHSTAPFRRALVSILNGGVSARKEL